MPAVQRRFGPTGPTGPPGPVGGIGTTGPQGPTGPSGLDSFTVTLTSGAVYPINVFEANQFTMANFIIRASQGTNRSASEFKVIHNNEDLDWVEYASLSIGTLEIEFTASLVGSDVVLNAQCLAATSQNPVQIKIVRTKF